MTGPPQPEIPEGSLSFFRRDERARPQPAAGLAAGKTVGDFRLIGLIGQGGMGQVWEAEQLSLGRRHVAVKFVRPERIGEHQLELFAREARAGGRLQHPGIVTVYGHGASDGLAWIAMEFVSGSWTLRDFLDEAAKASELPATYDEDVARLVAGIADAMQAAHEAGVIHRDLKPQNVLITPDDRPKVTDFGLARIIDESALSQTGEFAGTYFYMSPEQVTAKRMGIDHRTDVFSLGVVLYELLALQRPFQGDTTQQVAEQIVTLDPPDLRAIRSKIPRDLAVITGKALEKSREKRFPTMAEFAADLRRWLANEPIHARPPTRWDRAAKWIQRNPAKTAVGGVVAAALVVISALLAENVRARGVAEERRVQAELAFESERERLDEVMRLSALQEVEELVAEADELWPAHPENAARYSDWLARARRRVAELPAHRATLEKLRALALPRTDEERRLDRESHPDAPELARIERDLALREPALAARRDGGAPEPPPVDWNRYPTDPGRLNALAWERVGPRRSVFGEEPLGLALARRAVELAPQDADALDTLAKACLLLGLDDDALAASSAAVDAAPAGRVAEFEQYFREIEQAVERTSAPETLAREAAELSALRERARTLAARLDEQRDWRFPAELPEARWWNNQLAKLIAGLEELERGLLAEDAVTGDHGWSIPKRNAFAARLRDGFAPGGEYALRWEQALPEIRLRYPGLELGPELGLVPIGTDPDSGLWEFADLQTGDPPGRDARGKLVLDAESSVVFVLLPGASFRMGAQKSAPGATNYDPWAVDDEDPVHPVTLSAFFLSKFELTQGQYARVTGTSPSQNGPHNWNRSWSRSGRSADLSHPVENVSWIECARWCARRGFVLPSEAQWEYAARAGTTTPWWTGAEPASLEGAVNLADAWAEDHGGPRGWAYVEFEDGYTVSAPAGALPANPFGLHEMLGNVMEWCRDGYFQDAYEFLPVVEPAASTEELDARVRRGGSYSHPPELVRCASRSGPNERIAVGDCGFRPARALGQRP